VGADWESGVEGTVSGQRMEGGSALLLMPSFSRCLLKPVFSSKPTHTDAPAAGACMADSDCSLARTNTSGQICKVVENGAASCKCQGGVDVCVKVGECVDYCTTLAAEIASFNSMVRCWLGMGGWLVGWLVGVVMVGG